MKVLLTGATGGLGYRTLEQLVSDADITSIIASGRILKVNQTVEHPKISYQLGDLSDVDLVASMVESVDVIIHAAALSSPWGREEDFMEANVLSMQNLLKSAKNSSVQRFIYISTPSVYVNGKDRLNVSECSPLPEKFINSYARTKYLAEQELQKSGIPYVILRPRALIGRGDSVIMPRLLRAHAEGKLKIIGSGQNLVDLTSLANAAQAIHLALKVEGDGLNQIYNISNGAPVYLWDYIEKVLNLLGENLNKKKVPFWMVKLVAQVLEMHSNLSHGKEPSLTYYGVGTLANSFTMDISKAQKLLGYQPKVTTDEALVEFVEWYKKTQWK